MSADLEGDVAEEVAHEVGELGGVVDTEEEVDMVR